MRQFLSILILLVGSVLSAQDNTYTLTMEISKLSSVEGKIAIRLMNTAEEVVQKQWLDVTGTEMTAYFEDVAPGTYAVSYYHDANDNGKLDFKWYGAPDEGTGNTNDVKGTFGPPDFEKQLFELNGSMTVSMKTLKY